MNSRKCAIVTGAASGLGRAISLELARHGWRIALADVNEAGSQETLDLVRQAGGEGQVERLDVTDPDAWQALREKLRATWPTLDLLVNNAGVGVGGEVGQLPPDGADHSARGLPRSPGTGILRTGRRTSVKRHV